MRANRARGTVACIFSLLFCIAGNVFPDWTQTSGPIVPSGIAVQSLVKTEYGCFQLCLPGAACHFRYRTLMAFHCHSNG
ncbi:MAG: hypothetical protein JW913_00190 [Chitinispirillaceae bacterium]|nr:hypothetical protein [Chitinispirillaceae bacterium]